MQARRKIIHVRRERTGKNAVGQPIYSVTGQYPRWIFGTQPIDEQERNEAARAGRTVSDRLMMMPDEDYSSADQVILPSGTYDVHGDVRDYNDGPFGYEPGFAVGLRKVTNA